MKTLVQGHELYVYTGGKPVTPGRPTVVFIHGVLNDHSVWILQSRYFAQHGWNVLAIDLPGQGHSAGEPPASVDAASKSVVALLDALGVEQAALVGHSFGSLIALHTAAIAPTRVSAVALVGTAFPMRVSPALLESSLNTPQAAIELVNTLSHSTLAPPPSALGPGTWLYGGSRALMRRMLASNTLVNVFHRGFSACDAYADGEADVARLSCPALFVLGAADLMTPPKAAQGLVKGATLALAPLGLKPQAVTLPAGHSLMTEAPDGVLGALKTFLGLA